jgi:hypothetical protein
MMRILLVFCTSIVVFTSTFAQIDTANIPIWQTMMQDRNVNFYKTLSAYNKYYQNRTKEKHTGWKAFERWAHHASLTINPDGTFPPADHVIKEYNKFLRSKITPRSATGTWTALGSFGAPETQFSWQKGTGRINAIAFHPTNQNIIYIGAPQGGFWMTQNKGLTWATTTDNMATLGVSAIIVIPNITPTNPPTILIGTGDRDANDATGLGVYKSTDGGLTFTASNTGFPNSGNNITVNKLLVNPLNPNTIIAATSGGIYISTNQGTSWTLKGNAINMKDIQYKPLDVNILYACNDGNFYRSTDGGNTWNINNSGLSGTRNRLVIGVTPANPNIVYLLASNGDFASSKANGLQNFYKSSNSGVNFTTQTNASSPNILGWNYDGSSNGGQGWYDLAIATSNTDSNMVFSGGVNIFKSINKGANWFCAGHWTGNSGFDPESYVHADIHVFARNPLNNELYAGSDGGIYNTKDDGMTWDTMYGNLNIRQFYDLDVSAQSSKKIISGAQDNGTDVLSGVKWKNEIGGDGMKCAISPFDSSKMIGSLYYNQIRTTSDNGNSWYTITEDSVSESGSSTNAPWVTPFALHPKIPNFLVLVSRNAWKTTNCFNGNSTSFNKITNGQTTDGSAVAFSQVSNNMCFIANYDRYTGDVAMKRTNNIIANTPTWTTLTPPGSGTITSIATSYRDSNILFISQGNKVYKSNNAGTTWIDISGANLPSIKMFSVVLDKYSDDRLYVGSQAGVYVKDNNVSSWNLFNTGIPNNSEIRKLVISYDTSCSYNSKITAATYGRGAWQSDLLTTNNPVVDFSVPASTCAGLPVNFTNNTTNAPDSFLWTITPSTVTYLNGTNNKSANPQVSFNTPGNYSIQLYAKKNNFGYCSLKKTNIISINNSGNLTFNHGDSTICPNDSIKYIASGATNYSWSPTTGLSADTGKNVTVSPIATTTYTVISNVNGNCLDTATFTVSVKPFPNVTITGNPKICVGDTGTFVLSGADSFKWTPNTFLSNDTARNIRIAPTNNITYSITAKSGTLCPITRTLNIFALTKPTFTYANTPSKSICLGDSTQVDYTGNISAVNWNPNTNITTISGTSASFKPTSTTKYYVNTTDTTFCPLKDSFTLTIVPVPTVSISGPSQTCTGASINLTASGADSFTWSPSTYLNQTNTASVTCTPTADITYTVTGKTSICSSTATKQLTVGTTAANVQITGNPVICPNLRTKLTATGADTYTWSPASAVDNATSNIVNATTSSPLTLTVTGVLSGCTGTKTITLTPASSPVVTYTSNKTNNSICNNDTVKLNLKGAKTYSISPIYNLSNSNDSTFFLFPRNTTEYTITGTSALGCNGSNKVNVTVNTLPTISISPQISTITRGDSLKISATGNDAYTWTPTTYIVSGANNKTMTTKPDSNIVYTLTATTSFGCKATGVSIVYVKNKPTNPTSIQIATMNDIKWYPNPAKEYVTIETPIPVEMEIYSLEGKTILKSDLKADKNNVSLQEISKGIYYIGFKFEDKIIKIEKILIDK